MVSSSCDVAVWIGWYNAFVNRVAWFSFCAFPPILWNGECTKWYLICCISSAVTTTHNRASLPVAALRCQMHAGGRWASQQSSSLFFPLVHLGPWKYNIFLSIVFHVLLPNKPNLDYFFCDGFLIESHNNAHTNQLSQSIVPQCGSPQQDTFSISFLCSCCSCKNTPNKVLSFYLQ